MAPRQDISERELRRQRAGSLFRAGWSQAAVAREFGVSPAAVCGWARAWRHGGEAALEGRKGRRGPKIRLDAAGWAKVEAVLKRGPGRTVGHRWTLGSVSALVHRVTGIRYHPGHVARVLLAYGWSLQPRQRSGDGKLPLVQEEPPRQAAAPRTPLCARKCGRLSLPKSRFCRECALRFRSDARHAPPGSSTEY
jgi:transposase